MGLVCHQVTDQHASRVHNPQVAKTIGATGPKTLDDAADSSNIFASLLLVVLIAAVVAMLAAPERMDSLLKPWFGSSSAKVVMPATCNLFE